MLSGYDVIPRFIVFLLLAINSLVHVSFISFRLARKPEKATQYGEREMNLSRWSSYVKLLKLIALVIRHLRRMRSPARNIRSKAFTLRATRGICLLSVKLRAANSWRELGSQ